MPGSLKPHATNDANTVPATITHDTSTASHGALVFDVHVATEHKSDPPASAADRAAPASPPSSRGQAFMLGDELPLEDDGRDEDEDSDDSEDLSDDEDECWGRQRQEE
ncbi:uncharacterized protein ACA1_396890 [Acanthamoeba castellanii str. Neff]|uniref:Uncharacterized protein n=1 Tax=Acanthamoeba castellanii (strain ATCC 30010 / Neff) TaxID=1257118 RepID=L8HDM0_ACACF|nr:uncharacterized protein ACA1_396890 [Acanthamoeba castellanii str. Neff]ELR22863.1 hypothetical protein ACA1_396890 [Acanthamoeba castellanii str. Neff]